MSDIVGPLLESLNAHPELAGLVTFFISAAESVAIIGTIVPGSITMTAIGALAGAGIIPLWGTLLWAILGAIVGDGISYWIGYHFKDRLPHLWPFRKHPNLLKTGELFFLKYGSMSVFIGRFVGPVRALVPLVAGMLGMRPIKFLIANIASAIGWAPAYMLPGILLGAVALELPPDIAIHVAMVFLFIVLLILLCLWFIYKLFQLIQNQTDQLKNWIWNKLKHSRYFSTATVFLGHYDAKKTHGQLRLALYFILISLLFLGLVCYVKAKGAANIAVNDALFHLFRGIRTETIDTWMLNITLLGQKQIILPAVGVFFICLLIYRRYWTAVHALALGILAGGAVLITKHIIKSPRPWGILQNPDTYSMPSGHTTLATTVFMGLALLIAMAFTPRRRWPLYSVAVLISLAVGISRLYLGAHWFTDVLASWLLSATLLIIIIISFRHRPEKYINPLIIFCISLLVLTATYSVYHYRYFTQTQIAYTELNWPTLSISMKNWWEKDDLIPSFRSSLFGFHSQYINIEWVGNLDKIRGSLQKEGWSKPPVRNWISTIHRLADVSSSEYLPMVSPQYLDKKPALILTRYIEDVHQQKKLLVIRLWDANRFISDSHSNLWVGIVAIVPRSYSWLFLNHAQKDVYLDPALIFPNKTGSGDWQWKTITVNHGTKKLIAHKIILIRESKFVHKKK